MDTNQTQQPEQKPQQPQVPQAQQQVGTQEDITGVDPNRLMAAISYLGILVLIPLFLKRDDSFVLFHAKQGLVIFIGYVLASILARFMPIAGNLLWLVMIVASIAGFIQALRGLRWKVPGIGDIADTFKL